MFFIIISFYGTKIYGNDIDFNIKKYTHNEGLPENHVKYIINDSKGFLWIITNSGISRFDGNSIYKFSKERFKGNKEILFRNGFQINDDKILLISVEGELWCYKYSTGKFENLSVNTKLSEYYFRKGILSKSGNLWFSVSGGLLEINLSTDFLKFHPFIELTNDPKKFFNPFSIKEDKNGNLWMTYYPVGIIQFNTKTNEFIQIKNNKLNEINFYNISFTVSGDFFYSISEFGTFIKVNINTNSIEVFQKEKIFGQKILAVQHSEVYSDSIFIIATNNGVFLLNTYNYNFKYLTNNYQISNSLSSNNIENIFLDSDKNIWLCAVNALNQMSPKENNFILNEFSFEKNINDSKFEILYTHKDEKYFWYLTTNGFIIKNHITGKSYHYLKYIQNSFANLGISRFLLKDSENNYWIATWGDGLIRFRLDKNFKPGDNIKFDYFLFGEKNTTTISGNHLSHIVEDNSGNLWISHWNAGLSLLLSEEKNKSNPKFKRIQRQYGYNIQSDYIGNLLLDNYNYLWMTSGSGLLRMNLSNYNFEKIYIDKSDSSSDINNPQFLYKDIDGSILLGSFSGVSKIEFDATGNFNTKILNIPFNLRLMQIIADNEGKIWFGSNNSILFSYDMEKNNLKSYNIESEINGFSFGFSFPSSDIDGNLYFKGLQFNPSKIITNKVEPNVYLSSVLVNGNEFIFDKDASLIHNINLSYNDNNILIKYSSINFIKSELNRFAYRIKNKNSEWTYISKPEIFLAALEPGEYFLELNGANNDGIWSENPFELSIIITPPFWSTFIFRFLIFISFVIISFILLRKRYIRIRTERENIQKFAQKLINTQEEERSRVAKELHDSIGQNLLVLKNLFSLYQKNVKSEPKDVEKLDNLISDSIDEVRSISSSLHPHQLRRLGFKTALESMVNKLNNASINGISFEVKIHVEELKEPFDIIVYRIIQEAINNIIKHSGATICNIKILRNKNIIELIISDNGKGFDSNIQHGGLGLIGIQERAAYIDGKLNINSSAAGTTINLIFKEK